MTLTTNNKAYSTSTSMTVTNLNSLANSATAGWQSVRVDDYTSSKALDYQISVKLTMANTAPANDKAVYVYVCPAYYDGSVWYMTDGGTTTLPGGTEGTYTIANPNDLKLLGVLSYTTQNMVLQGTWNLSTALGQFVPDGFSIIIVNFSGAALSSSGNVVQYKAITETNQ